MTINFFSPLSFVAVFGSGIRDPGSRKGKNQDPVSGINIPDPQHWSFFPALKDVTYPKDLPLGRWVPVQYWQLKVLIFRINLSTAACT
jgi:hypothetical protein